MQKLTTFLGAIAAMTATLLADEPALAGRALVRWRALAPESPAMRASAIRLALARIVFGERGCDQLRL